MFEPKASLRNYFITDILEMYVFKDAAVMQPIIGNIIS